jgi:membrane protein DedA with SNARE-associated domain/rhodanese-related sulfurtransferase
MWSFPLLPMLHLGPLAVFLAVFIARCGVPIPAAPLLVLTGTLLAVGGVAVVPILLATLAGALAADLIWFFIGRRFGRKILNRLIRFSLTFDSALRVARGMFERYGAPLLAVSKLVPGMGLVTPALLGTTSMPIKVFVFWDLIGTSIWAAFWLSVGAALDRPLTYLAGFAHRHDQSLAGVLVVLGVLALIYRWLQRIRFSRWLANVRISPQTLDQMIRSDPPPVILDARPASVRKAEPFRIRGAQVLDLASPDRFDVTKLSGPLVVYCICPNEATAKRIVKDLQRKGIMNVQALKGGLDAWQRAGFPVERIPAPELHQQQTSEFIETPAAEPSAGR